MEDFATALAHEIKNPAAVALAHVNLLRIGCGRSAPDIDGDDEENLTHHLNHIETALTNICDLVREMLAASYNRSEMYEVDLGKILADILETYRAAWPDIDFSFDSPTEPLVCLGHETSLRIIFSNVIKNAVEALEVSQSEGGEIKIAVEHGEDALTVTVFDGGAAASESRDKPHGNGLGLAICRNLANGLGASFEAAPQEDGGFAVTVKLRTVCPEFA